MDFDAIREHVEARDDAAYLIPELIRRGVWPYDGAKGGEKENDTRRKTLVSAVNEENDGNPDLLLYDVRATTHLRETAMQQCKLDEPQFHALMQHTMDTVAPVMTLDTNRVDRRAFMDCVYKTMATRLSIIVYLACDLADSLPQGNGAQLDAFARALDIVYMLLKPMENATAAEIDTIDDEFVVLSDDVIQSPPMMIALSLLFKRWRMTPPSTDDQDDQYLDFLLKRVRGSDKVSTKRMHRLRGALWNRENGATVDECIRIVIGGTKKTT